MNFFFDENFSTTTTTSSSSSNIIIIRMMSKCGWMMGHWFIQFWSHIRFVCSLFEDLPIDCKKKSMHAYILWHLLSVCMCVCVKSNSFHLSNFSIFFSIRDWDSHQTNWDSIFFCVTIHHIHTHRYIYIDSSWYRNRKWKRSKNDKTNKIQTHFKYEKKKSTKR